MTKEEKEAIQIVNYGKVRVNNTYKPILDLSMIPGPYSSENELGMSWKVTSFKQDYMDLNIDYH